MAFLTGKTSLTALYLTRRPISHNSNTPTTLLLSYFLRSSGTSKRWLSTGTDSAPGELGGKSAYELLGVSETSSLAEIKTSFRKLAKETHPDLAQSSTSDSSASRQFVQILAAYEILSDSEKRSHYDRYLLSQRMLVRRHSRQGTPMYTYESSMTTSKQMEVVEWLKWYRLALSDILADKKVVVGSGYFDVLERDFYSAIHSAYYGPLIESMDLLPDCFEAEERSADETPEVLHLVSGRDLFGMVCLTDKVLQLTVSKNEKNTSFISRDSGLRHSSDSAGKQKEFDAAAAQMQAQSSNYHTSDAYRDLELHVSGKLVAVATRVPPRSYFKGIRNDDSEDHIHVYLSSDEDLLYLSKRLPEDAFKDIAGGSRIPLGTISGLGTKSEEGYCSVYNNSGKETHVIMKHRTLLVKHLHWYRLGDKVSVCECRCRRARLPPSRFWLFEPRCGMHDIGGWYVETFGVDSKRQNVSCGRYWDGFDGDERLEKRLHPAVYLLALAYRTLDLEDERRRKRALRYIVEGKLSGIISLLKKYV